MPCGGNKLVKESKTNKFIKISKIVLIFVHNNGNYGYSKYFRF